MPGEGWKSAAIREPYYEQLEKLAKKEGRSVTNYLERQLIEKRIVEERHGFSP